MTIGDQGEWAWICTQNPYLFIVNFLVMKTLKYLESVSVSVIHETLEKSNIQAQ